MKIIGDFDHLRESIRPALCILRKRIEVLVKEGSSIVIAYHIYNGKMIIFLLCYVKHEMPASL